MFKKGEIWSGVKGGGYQYTHSLAYKIWGTRAYSIAQGKLLYGKRITYMGK